MLPSFVVRCATLPLLLFFSIVVVSSFIVPTIHSSSIHEVEKAEYNHIHNVVSTTTTNTAAVTPPSSSSLRQRRRQLAVGDFDSINTLIQDMTLQLEDQTITMGQLELMVSNLQCQKIQIGDLFLDYQEINMNTTLELTIRATDFSMDCSADYSFNFLAFNGNGDFLSRTQNNTVNATIQLIAPNGFSQETPSISDVTGCSSSVNVVDTQFNGGTVGYVLNLFEDAVSQVISSQANMAVCTILDEVGVTFFNDVLNATSATFDTWLQPIPPEYSDPLLAEQNYVPPEGVTLLSLSSSSSSSNVSFSTTESIGAFVVNAITNADSLLDQMVDDPNSPTGTTLEINVFLRDNFLDDNGVYTLNFENFEVDNSGDFNPVLYDGHDRLSRTSVRINTLRVTGLDTMTTFLPLIELGQYTFRNELAWDRLSIQLDLTIDVESSQLADPILVSDVPIRTVQNITLALDLEQINVNASLFIAIDQNKFDTLPLGALLKDPVVCFLSALDTMEVSGLEVSLGQFSEPIIDGFDSPGVQRLLDTVIEAGFIVYEPTLIRAVPYFFQVPVRNIIKNDILNQFLGDNNECLSNAQDIAESSLIDFRDLLLTTEDASAIGGSGTAPYGSLMPVIFNILQEEYLIVDPTTGLSSINHKLLSDIGLEQSGTPGRLFFPGNFLNQTREIRSNGRQATIRLRLYDIYLNNIDSLGVPLTILEPVENEPYSLYNEASIGVDRPLRFGFRFFLGITNDDNDVANDVEVFMDFTSLQAMFTIFAKVSERAFMIFPLHDIFNLQCWLATMPAPELNEAGFRIDDDVVSLAIVELIASVSDLAFNISCIQCTGSRVPELSELFSGLKDSDDVTAFANGVFNYLKDLVNGDFMRVAADRVLNDAKYQCPHSSLYDANYVRNDYGAVVAASQNDSTISFFLGLIIVLAVLLFSTITIILATRYIVRRRHAKWVATLPPSHIRTLNRQQALVKETNQLLDTSTPSMFRSESIPILMRLSIPIIILGNIGLFLSGHLSLAANVSVSVSLAGQSFQDEDLFQFSVANSTIELWKAGGYGLAMIIFLLSFAWPYSKQLIVLGLWFAPPTTVSVSTRGSALHWLDLLGKWSIVDIFVLVMVLVGFRLSIQSPDLEFIPDDFYSVDLLVAPRWGLYSNMMAQILSQIVSHWIIHYHRRIVFTAAPHLDPTRHADICDAHVENQPKSLESNDQAQDTDRLFEHAFSRPHRGESDRLISRAIVNPFLYILAIASSAFVVVGCIVPTYSLNKLGIIGLLVEAGQSFNAAYNEYSVFSTVKTIIDQASVMGNLSDYIGLSSLSALIILTVLLVPILQAVVLLIQWFAPMTKRRRFRFMVTLEALQAWQYMEVYLLSVLIASWQLGSISSQLINPYCSALEEFFAELSYYGILKLEDAQCYRSDIGLEPTFYVLLVAAVVLAIITSFVSKAVTHYMRDMDPQQNPFHKSNAANDVESVLDFSDEKKLEDASTVQPTPVLFTDRYRWLLRRKTEMISSEHEVVDVPTPSTKSQGTILLQNTSSTMSAPGSFIRVDSDRRFIDTAAESDDSDMYVDESPISEASPSNAIYHQSNVAEPPIKPSSAAGGAVGAVVRRGYDVDEDEWIVESVSNNSSGNEATDFLIEGVPNDGVSIDPDVETSAMLQSDDMVGGKVDLSNEGNGNKPDVNEAIGMNSVDESVNADTCSGTDTIRDVDDDGEVNHILNTDDSRIDIDMVNSPLSAHSIDSSPPSPDVTVATKGSDISRNMLELKGNRSDRSQSEMVPDMKHSISMHSDEKSYDDIRCMPSSCSDIIFDDVPSSPDSITASSTPAATSPSYARTAAGEVAPFQVTTDLCRVTENSDVVAVVQTPPSGQKSEHESVGADGVNTLYDVDDDVNTTCNHDGSQPDDRSVGSDQTPRRILQMN